jgi:anthranilate phosphoribosyltransferase
MIREAIGALVSGADLDEEAAYQVMGEVMKGEATSAQIAGFLVGLRLRGETAAHLAGAARAMREAATPLVVHRRPLVDTCGTGGDGRGTFNISTTAAFVVAGAGPAVAKHGNRAASSRSGSADCLAALGVSLELPPEAVARAVDELGIGFLFAPAFHPSMRHAAGPRRELGVRTLMNLLGPLTNPAGADHQVIGVSEPSHLDLVAGALFRLGTARSWVVYGEGGYDELTSCGPAQVREVTPEGIRSLRVDPAELGLPAAPAKALAGGDPETNAAITLEVLRGGRGPARDTVLLNAAAALVVSGEAEDLREGLAVAARSVDSGAALDRLEALRRFPRDA